MNGPGEVTRLRDQLLDWMRQQQQVVVAFSGGVDSSVVAQAAHLACGPRAVALTADSPSVPRAELQAARRVAAHIGITHVIVTTHELEHPDYRRNDGHRCYYCKTELYTRIADYLRSHYQQPQPWTVVSGANRDDLGDFRPGLRAAAEHGVRHPLQELGLGKAEVRALARHWDLPVWDKPASPCLSSRLAPGMAVTAERLARIEAAEAFLRQLGIPDCRVRYHTDELARIEIPIEHLPTLCTEPLRSALTAELSRLGFRFITLDLQGLRSGSLNALIPLELRRQYQTDTPAPSAAPPTVVGNPSSH
jgi:uncharacterized protein